MTEINIRREGRAGRITLNRPEALNALTSNMVHAIDAALSQWWNDSDVALVMIDATGDRAFAAGGDIIDLYNSGRAGDYAFGQKFWAHEYGVNARIANYPKPFISFMHGFVMGGGVGVSAHGSHRIVTDSTKVAMPECGIGLVPDVGGSWILANAPGHCGEYLGLSATRMNAADAIYAGFADVHIPQMQWETVKAALAKSGDPTVLDRYVTQAPPGSLQERQSHIDAIFALPTAREVEAALAEETSEWAHTTLKTLRQNCPLSVACAHQMIRNAREMNLLQALTQEYRFISRCMSDGEFLEGIRAAVIDKDRNPQWEKPTLGDVADADITHMLSVPQGGDVELEQEMTS